MENSALYQFIKKFGKGYCVDDVSLTNVFMQSEKDTTVLAEYLLLEDVQQNMEKRVRGELVTCTVVRKLYFIDHRLYTVEFIYTPTQPLLFQLYRQPSTFKKQIFILRAKNNEIEFSST